MLIERLPRLHSGSLAYCLAAVLILLTAAACLFSRDIVNFPYLAAFLAAVVVCTLLGRGPAIVAVILAVLLSDFFFIPPLFSFNFDRVTLAAAGYYASAVLLVLVAARIPVRKGFDQKIKLILFLLAQSFAPAREPGESKESRILGRLDGDIDGEIFGWALDTTEPSLAPTISVYVEDRLVGEVNAVYYRPDVGSHSFYFDLARCSAPVSGAHVEARLRSGERLPNSPLVINIPAIRTERHPEAVLFMHISKTAGTAFREAMVKNYRQSEVAYLYPDPPGFLSDNLALLPLQQRANFRLVVGHFQYGIEQFLPQPSTYISIVRDPVARVISEFRYLLKKQPAGNGENDSPLHLVDLLEQHRYSILDNHMVRCFSGVSETDFPPGRIDRHVYELAVDHLRTKFAFVGHQERSQEAYSTLQQRFDWKAGSLELVNAASIPISKEYEAARTAIEHFNRWDCLFYSEVRQIFP
jgi:Domain of unknown function (DUF4118)/Sulfotransferase family